MEGYDSQKAARVWQRVCGASSPEVRPGLLGMIVRELEAAALYKRLSLRYPGQWGQQLHKLSHQALNHAACLKGLEALSSGSPPRVTASPPALESTDALLRYCCNARMGIAAEYERHATDGDYGQVFAQLAQQSKHQCCLLLELLGSTSADDQK